MRKLFFIIPLLVLIFIIIFISGCVRRPIEKPEEQVPEEKGLVKIHDQRISGEIKIGDLTVDKGDTLTIEPGTIVRFQRGSGMVVHGVLKAVGTADKPIRFTSAAPQPEHGDWRGIHLFPGSAGSVLDHVIVEYGSMAVYVEDNITLSNSIIRWTTGSSLPLYSTATIIHNRIYQPGHCQIEVHYKANPIIEYNTIWGSTDGSGIRIESCAHPIIRHNIIRDNKYSGIDITWSSSATVEYNTITGNGLGVAISQRGFASKSIINYNNIYTNKGPNLQVETPETLIAAHNWWGTTENSSIKPRMSIAKGATVVYTPYETSAVDIGSITYDFENNETYEHLPMTENNTFKYIFWENDSTRTVEGSIIPPGISNGIAWDGDTLYIAVADTPTNKIFKLDKLGNILGSFMSPATQTAGLAFDGQNLWVVDYTQVLVFEMGRSGNVIKSIPAPCTEPQGLTYDGQYLWILCYKMPGIAYQFDTSGKAIRSLQIGGGLSALAWDGKYLWSSAGQRLIQVDPSNGKMVRFITSSGVMPQFLAWQEPYLWTVEYADGKSEHTRLIKLLPSKMKEK